MKLDDKYITLGIVQVSFCLVDTRKDQRFVLLLFNRRKELTEAGSSG
jgi:hypothetical protein